MSQKNNNFDKKVSYPISVNNQHCVGPCYYSNTKIVHPITLDEIKDVEHNFCPVNAFVYVDPITKTSTLSTIDKCYVPTENKTEMNDFLRDTVLTPQFHFSSDYFVKIYYKIYNIEDLLRWIDTHNEDPYKTRERVFNNGMAVYGNQITIIDHRIVKFLNEIMINYLPKIYHSIIQYIFIQGDEITLIDPDKNKSIKQDSSENIRLHLIIIRNYIKERFLGIDNIQQFMSKFIRYYNEEITNNNISNILVNHMIDYIIKRIKLTLDNQTQSNNVRSSF
jgi:hypothetical protein